MIVPVEKKVLIVNEKIQKKINPVVEEKVVDVIEKELKYVNVPQEIEVEEVEYYPEIKYEYVEEKVVRAVKHSAKAEGPIRDATDEEKATMFLGNDGAGIEGNKSWVGKPQAAKGGSQKLEHSVGEALA